ncbi:MAG: hypothetical protein MUC49_05620 [Raineya sp.]|nr:hypothetical protein [Raineya sp.]
MYANTLRIGVFALYHQRKFECRKKELLRNHKQGRNGMATYNIAKPSGSNPALQAPISLLLFTS